LQLKEVTSKAQGTYTDSCSSLNELGRDWRLRWWS